MDLLVQIHHENAEEDHGEDHLADGHGGVASIQRCSIADDDNETDYLRVMEVKREGGEKETERQDNDYYAKTVIISQNTSGICQKTTSCSLNFSPVSDTADQV